MTIKIGINGFGRIGRMVFRAAVQNFSDIQVVGINDLLEPDYLAYMLKYDSVHGRFKGEVAVEGQHLIVNGQKIRLSAERDPAQLKWNEVGADVVIVGNWPQQPRIVEDIGGGAGADSMLGGDGRDMVSYALSLAGVSVSQLALSPAVQVRVPDPVLETMKDWAAGLAPPAVPEKARLLTLSPITGVAVEAAVMVRDTGMICGLFVAPDADTVMAAV